MPETLSLPDLDALDSAALKALLLENHERYTISLSSSASEIERLILLVEKLQRMLFGREEREGAAPHRAAGVATGGVAGGQCDRIDQGRSRSRSTRDCEAVPPSSA